MRQGVEAMAEEIGSMTRLTRVLGTAGIVVDVVSIAVDVQNGGSFSSDVIESGAGAAGGAAVGAGACAAAGAGAGAMVFGSNPVGWVVGGTLLGGIAVGWGARTLWGAVVPLDARKSVDDFFVGDRPRLAGYTSPAPRQQPSSAIP